MPIAIYLMVHNGTEHVVRRDIHIANVYHGTVDVFDPSYETELRNLFEKPLLVADGSGQRKALEPWSEEALRYIKTSQLFAMSLAGEGEL